jgi:hypothetical protein
MSDSTTILDLLQTNQASKEVTANALFDALSGSALFGRRASTSVGLTWGYYGGRMTQADGSILTVANGSFALTPSATNYIYSDNGVIGHTTTAPTGWPGPLVGTKRALYAVVCGASTVTSYTDYRVPGTGSSGSVKLPFKDSRSYNIPCDGTTEASVLANAAINALSAAGGGILYMVGDDPTQKFYINGSIWARDKVIVVWVNQILMGPTGRLGVGGSLDDGTFVGVLRSDSLTGTNVLHLGAGTSDYTHYAVNQVIELRGQNDASGIAFERQRVTITAINTATNDLTVAPALQFDFLASYPSSDFPSDKTTIKIVNQTSLTTLTEGSLDVVVANASIFGINDIVCIEDTKLCSDVVGTSSANQIHMETNIVRSVDTGTNTVTLDLPLAHTYDGSFQPKMIRVKPATHAGHINPIIHYAVQSTSNSANAMMFLYAAYCFVRGLRVMGDPNTNPALSLGNRGHGCRISDGCIGNVVFDTLIHRPALWAAGQGYGVTCYNGARANTYKKVQANGCRHSVLFFKGAADNVVEDVTSIDVRISDIDFHGANETRNTVTNVKVIGGSSTAPDSSTKSCVKFGNPTHQVGPRGNTVRNVDMENAQDYAVWFLPSTDNLVKGITGTSAKGCFWNYDSGGTTLPLVNCWVEDVRLTGGTKHVYVDGGGNKVVNHCGARNLTVKDAPMTGSSYDINNAARFVLDKCGTINAAFGGAPVASSYVVQAATIDSFECFDFRQDGGNRGFMLTTCPNAVIDNPYFSGVFERIVFYDAGGNSGAKFLDYEARFDTSFIDAGAGSGVTYKAKRMAAKKITGTLTLPVTYTGTGNVITVGTGSPAETAGTFVLSGTIKPMVPLSTIKFRAIFPYVSVDATNTVVVTVYKRKTGTTPWTLVGVGVGRITGGANAGQLVCAIDEFVHTLQDMSGTVDIEVRFGSNASTTNVTLNGNFGGKDQPFIELEECVALG